MEVSELQNQICCSEGVVSKVLKQISRPEGDNITKHILIIYESKVIYLGLLSCDHDIA
jgi:hypothetical protein